MTRKNFLQWSAITSGGLVFGTALPACGGGGGSATATLASALPTFTANLAASRVSGVAPLYVNFDATGTTHHQSTNPTHELFYSWTFGDSGAGSWANGVQSAGLTSKNAAFGPVAGHVFEAAGTYQVELIVMDGVDTRTKMLTITVEDPDAVYAGTNTICISHSGTFTNLPPGPTPQLVNTGGNTDMFAAFNAHIASNKRILFCKADNWTCSAQMGFTNITNTIVGGYGNGVARAFGTGTLVNVDATAVSGSVFATYAGCANLRICDMKVLGSFITLGVSLNNGIVQMLSYRLEFRGVSGGFNAYPGGGGTNNVFDQHCLYECVVDDLYGYAIVDTPSASASASIGIPGTFTAIAHPFAYGNKVQLIGTPPAPLVTGTDYYVSATGLTANTFTLSASAANAAAGTSLALSGTGSCTVKTQALGGGIGAFVGIVRGGVMGCYFDTCNRGEQTLRIPYIDRGHINNNYIARPNQGKNVLKIHSFLYGEVALYSEKFVVTSNVMDLRGGYSYNGTTITQVGNCAMIIGNGGASPTERVRNGIVENNITHGCLGNPKNTLIFAQVDCPNMTVRNNIADFSLSDRTTSYTVPYAFTTVSLASVGTSTNDPTTGIRIYNNSLYSNINNAEVASFVLIQAGGVFAEVDRVDIKNNIWYLPFHNPGNQKKFAYRLSGSPAANPTNITADHNTDNNGDLSTSPGFVNTPPVHLTDWRPTAFWTINNGATVPVLRDFNNASRVGGTYDLGAVLP